jgi:hypothetical protein
LDDAQRQSYLLQLEIEEATRKLRLGDFAMPEGAERFVKDALDGF